MVQIEFATLAAGLRDAGIPVETREGPTDVVVTDVEHDSRQVRPGTVFCAVLGSTTDGHRFVPQAIEAGAAALLVERWLDAPIPQLRTPSVRRAMAHAAAVVHGHPSAALDVVGVTGTNGKTTTTHLLASILRSVGKRVEVVGTLGGLHTTPEATVLQRRLRAMVDEGADAVAAEISSHALDQHRADAVRFAVAAFSNLTPDHLDYHNDMEQYFEAKARLFDGRARHELINVDDPWGARLAEQRPGASRLSLSSIIVSHADLTGTRFAWRGRDVALPLPGTMNVANAVMAAEAAAALGVDPVAIADGLSAAPQVPGRMQQIDNPYDDRVVVVDYSHTPDSIERAIATLRASSGDRPITIVFGCGGDRDRAKRPLMAKAAEAADRVVITSDNPRSEDPLAIIADARAGLSRPADAIIEVDRREAIRLAVAEALAGRGAGLAGVVLVAGKGHETTQTIGGRALPFDDAVVAAELLAETSASEASEADR